MSNQTGLRSEPEVFFSSSNEPLTAFSFHFSFQSVDQPQSVDGNKSIRINLSDEFTTALRGCFQDGAWQGIDIRCSQQEEYRSLQGSYVPARTRSPAGSLHQRVQPDHSYDSVHQET